jgi:4-amino-4-deoxy-L-arabinose transferase-like glycosyltransferase
LVLALAVLKHLLIALTYCLAWLAGRQLLNQKGAWWVAAGLLLMPPFGWDSLRDQTHTVMVAMTMGCGGRCCARCKSRRPSICLIGLFCGLGMLSKYSYAMLIAPVRGLHDGDAGTSRHLRQGWWLAPLVGLLVFAPHAFWLASHWGMATTETVQKMSISTEASHLKGLGNLLKALLSPWACG